jgi:uncharacterized protein
VPNDVAIFTIATLRQAVEPSQGVALGGVDPERSPRQWAVPVASYRPPPPLPSRAIIRQSWSDFLFLHWRVEPSAIEPYLPAGTRADVHDGSAWVGLIPFVLSRHRFLPLPPVPFVGSFVEINVRTYTVDADGNRGVLFRSLEAQHLAPVLAARALFGLPYQWADAALTLTGDEIEYRSRRHRIAGSPDRPTTRIRARVSTEPVDTPLGRFLTDRWGFHERHLGRTIWARNTHEPWPLVEASLFELDDQLLEAAGFAGLAGRAPDSVLATPIGRGIATEFSAARRIKR